MANRILNATMSSMESVKAGNRDLQLYVARPGSGAHPGVLFVHAWWGFNECFKELCDRLAREGFLVVAPDLYDGDIASTIGEAEAASSALDRMQANTDVIAAFDFLRDHESLGSGLGVMGISMGVGFALGVVQQRANHVDAAGLFYGIGGGEFADTATPFLGHFAESDPFGSERDVEALRERLQAGDGSITFHTYPATEHWFLESDRPEYDEEAAQLAWSRTVEFLRSEL